MSNTKRGWLLVTLTCWLITAFSGLIWFVEASYPQKLPIVVTNSEIENSGIGVVGVQSKADIPNYPQRQVVVYYNASSVREFSDMAAKEPKSPVFVYLTPESKDSSGIVFSLKKTYVLAVPEEGPLTSLYVQYSEHYQKSGFRVDMDSLEFVSYPSGYVVLLALSGFLIGAAVLPASMEVNSAKKPTQ